MEHEIGKYRTFEEFRNHFYSGETRQQQNNDDERDASFGVRLAKEVAKRGLTNPVESPAVEDECSNF